MDIFRKYTRRSLKTNRSRTFVTIIGIILSMALLTAVIEGAYSGIQFLIRGEIERAGSYQIYISDLNPDQYVTILREQEIKESAEWKEVGWAKVDSRNEEKSYLHIQSVSDNFRDFVKVDITQGRMAESPDEIVLPNHLATIGGLQYKLGDIINLSVGQRVMSDGSRIVEAAAWRGPEEKLADTVEKTYKVVGFYERLDYSVESRACAGYTALTCGEQTAGYMGVFAHLKHPSRIYEYALDLGPGFECHIHTDLMTYMGTVRNGGIQRVIYGFAVILLVMIAFGSISLIYNSFSISLSERTRQFGILKSVGATKKQLRAAVMYEALLLGCIGIPAGLIIGCLGIGITLYCLRDAFTVFMGISGVQMKLVISPLALVISAVLCLIVILISAWIPAGRAVRIAPIEAIRQNRDTKISGKAVRTSKLTQKLFGFEGTMAAKNFKRNRKRYRITVVSLFMSVVLFISASSFCSYLTDAVGGVASDGYDMDIVYKSYNGSGMEEMPRVYSLVKDIKGVNDATYAEYGGSVFEVSTDALTDQFRKILAEYGQVEAGASTANIGAVIAFVMDEEFDKILAENGLNRKDYYDKASPRGVFYNHLVDTYYTEKGNKWFSAEPLSNAAFPVDLTSTSYRSMDGYIWYDFPNAQTGETEYWYFPEDYVREYWQTHENSDDMDLSKAIRLSKDEAVIKTTFTAADPVKTTSLALSSQEAAIIYPYSMADSVLGEDHLKTGYIGYSYLAVSASDPGRVFEEMKTVLSANGFGTEYLSNVAAARNSNRMLVTIINVFSYGFIIIISLIALANVFNTISTSIMLRRREFAMLKSIGLSGRGFSKMMNFECLIYGFRSLVFGIPAALLMTVWIWTVTGNAFDSGFYIPWRGVVIAVASVFIVVFATMLYSTRRIRRDNPIDALRNENL